MRPFFLSVGLAGSDSVGSFCVEVNWKMDVSLEVIFSRTETRENDAHPTKNTHREKTSRSFCEFYASSLFLSRRRARHADPKRRVTVQFSTPIQNGRRIQIARIPIVRAKGYRIRRDQSEKRQKDGDGEQKSERYSLERKERNERAEKTRSNAHLRTLLREDFLFCSELLFKREKKTPKNNGQKNAQKRSSPKTTFYVYHRRLVGGVYVASEYTSTFI